MTQLTAAGVEGQIKLDDQNIYDTHIDVVPLRARVGMVFQSQIPSQKVSMTMLPTARIHGLAGNKDELDSIVEASLAELGCGRRLPVA